VVLVGEDEVLAVGAMVRLQERVCGGHGSQSTVSA
jgi:hypothetical protein